jgi:argininosuccinate lyase
MKLWDKGVETEKLIEKFTIGKDNELDLQLASYDVLGTIAHIRMLQGIGLLSELELKKLEYELIQIFKSTEKGGFIIEEGIEDVHSQIELILTKNLGDIGKKVHTGRSRNDQVLLDLKLFIRDEIWSVANQTKSLFDVLISQSEKYKSTLIPGYTHFQIAMPSSFGLWFGAYAESLADDMIILQAAYRLTNQNPLGSGAGYGSSFPLNRTLTTELLGFETLSYNVVNAQMARGKVEKTVAFALGSIASTIAKLSMDVCLYSGQNFGFISFPENLTTGSSIMPHKKNPDVFELIRAKGNRLQALSSEISAIITNLPSGYHRDMQLIKESFIPCFEELKTCLKLCEIMIMQIEVNENLLEDEKYKFLFSVEEVNRLVLEGTPFRDAYKIVGKSIKDGTFSHSKPINHSHEGSIGNLCNEEIRQKMVNGLILFHYEEVEKAYKSLLHDSTL